jgi:hypothetical protein
MTFLIYLKKGIHIKLYKFKPGKGKCHRLAAVKTDGANLFYALVHYILNMHNFQIMNYVWLRHNY